MDFLKKRDASVCRRDPSAAARRLVGAACTSGAAHPRWMRNIGCDDDIGQLGGARLPTGAQTVTVVVAAGGEAASHLLLPIF
jgi:hypothetical protein